MTRDLDLIRLILQEAETRDTPPALRSYPTDQILYHYELAVEAGLLIAQLHRGSQRRVIGATPQRLTWAGHDFLELSRSQSRWQQAKRTLTEKGVAWTLETAQQVLRQLALDQLPPLS